MNSTRIARIVLVGALIVAAAASTPTVGVRAPAISPDHFSDLRWRCTGPFDGGPVASVTGEAGVPGVYVVTTPTGGAWKTIDGGGTWSSIPTPTSPPATDRWIDPANARRIVRTDDKGIEVSLDAGQTWLASHHLPIANVARIEPREHPAEPAGRRQIAGTPATVSIADPSRPGLVFAGAADAVYVSFDDGVEWQPLQLNMPGVAINDLDIHGRDLVAATAGRSTWQLDDISPLRQLTAASASAAAMLFKPPDGVLAKPETANINLDYYLGPSTRGDVTLEIANATGRVVHAATSAAANPDLWLPVTRPLSAAPGHHRVVWNLRFDPPPAQKHRYAQMARAAFEEMPSDPDGPRVLAGTYRLKLTVAGASYSQTVVVRDDPRATPASIADARRDFDLSMKIYDAMQITYRTFLQLASVRAGLKPLLTSTNEQTAALATGLDARLVQLDGTDWTGLFIPDEDQDDFDPDEAEEQGLKHPDFIPPKPVSVSKDYDDPTSILGRRFANINHSPALTIVSADLGEMLTKAMTMPDVAGADYDRSCQQLSDVLDTWRAMNASELAGVNAELAKQKLPPLPIATTVPVIVCR